MPRTALKTCKYSFSSEAHIVARLKELGHGKLSVGIRRAALARSTNRNQQLWEAIHGLIEAYDSGEPLDYHIGRVLNFRDDPRTPGRDYED